MGLTVAEKRSIFLQMERESGSNRMDKRHATQPVTLDEIEKASQLIQQQISAIPIEQLKSNIMNEPKELLGSMLGELSQRNTMDVAEASGRKLGRIPRSSSVGSSYPLPAPVLPGRSSELRTVKRNGFANVIVISLPYYSEFCLRCFVLFLLFHLLVYVYTFTCTFPMHFQRSK